MKQWWKETVFYQIYMPSFCDGNQDGIGDFIGIRSKLPYLKQLGIGGIWLTPFYPSPKVDQGYDISDYYGIDKDYGTMEDFTAFIHDAHALGIRVIADVVINHTSTEHAWFLESKSSVSNPKRDWYVWKHPKEGGEPNNWESFFGEKAWEYDERTKMYYYHSFAREQADLNWANPEVKQAVFEMLDFWVEKGIDGFRLDVINNLTLTDCMTDNPSDKDGTQLHRYDVNQPGIHDFMRELKKRFCGTKELFLVGEISSDELEQIHSFTGDGQLDTTFNFNLGSMPEFDFSCFITQLSRMTELYGKDEYPTVFFGSHDMARFPSRFRFDEKQSKNLFTLMMSFRAIPFLYFGDEIGMKNYECYSLEDARDIQGIIAYRGAKERGLGETEAIALLNEKSRDHSRNTMYWEDSLYGGFSDVTPWIGWQKQPGKSAAAQAAEEHSLFSYVSKLIVMRKECSVFAYGDCSLSTPADGVIFISRKTDTCEALAIINFSEHDFTAEAFHWGEGSVAKAPKLCIETTAGAAWSEGERLNIRANNSAVVLWEKESNREK